jgi:transcriptional regulator GlxA family with amidase domain
LALERDIQRLDLALTQLRRQWPCVGKNGAIHLLRERLDQSLDLGAIAKEVGVAPHQLSRRVSTETGSTLQRHLRRLRIERACEALHTGRMNITEVALEVGYQSPSHFAKAFREETGDSPSHWLRRGVK